MTQVFVRTKSGERKPSDKVPSAGVNQDQQQAQEIVDLIARGQAQAALERGLECLKDADGEDPANPHVRAAVASAYISLADKLGPKTKEEEAVKAQLYTKALESIKEAEGLGDGPSAALYVLRGKAHAGIGEWIDAAKSFKFAVQHSPENHKEPLNLLFILALFRGTEEPHLNTIIGHKDEIGLLLNSNPERLWLKTIGILQDTLRMHAEPQDVRSVLSVDRWALDLCRIAAHEFGKERELAAVLINMEAAGILDPRVDEYTPLTLKLDQQLREELKQQARDELSEGAGDHVKSRVWDELARRGVQVQPVNVNAARVGPANTGASGK